MKDLFGNQITADQARDIERKGKRKATLPKGNAAPIGSGPDGETCKTCAHSYSRSMAKRYYKCELVRATGGPATDIRLKWPACSRWERKRK